MLIAENSYPIFLGVSAFLILSAGAITPKAEIELLIVCDKEFSDQFDQDHQTIIDYWAVYMRDVNLRFKTLQSLDISFRVTGIEIIKETSRQPFIEQARKHSNEIYFNATLHDEFSKWIYTHAAEFPCSDVALLITGARVPSNEFHLASYQSSRSACLKYDSFGMIKSTIVLHSTATWGYDCAALEASFATILGADDDVDTGCKFDQYLMSLNFCDEKQYYFSECSDDGITAFLMSNQSACLKVSSAQGVNVLKAAEATHPPTFIDQCRMITSDSNIIAPAGDHECVVTNCSLMVNGSTKLVKRLHPLDNTPCGDGDIEKFCFRGRCLEQGRILRNIGSNMCLDVSEHLTYFDAETVAKMVTCDDSLTPLTRFKFLDEKIFGMNFLGTPIWNYVYHRLDYSCLKSEDQYAYFFRFGSCINGSSFELHFLDGENEEFVLKHPKYHSCLKVNYYNNLILDELCNEDDISLRWTLEENRIKNAYLDLFKKREDRKWVQAKNNPEGDKLKENDSNIKVFYYIAVGIVLALSCIVVVFVLRRYWKQMNIKRRISYRGFKSENANDPESFEL